MNTQPSAPIPKPRITARGIGLAAVFWGLYTVLYGLLIAQGEDVPLVWALLSQVVSNLFLALYSIPVWWLTVREMDTTHWAWVGTVHICLAPVYAWIALESYLTFFSIGLGVPLRTELANRYEWMYFSNLTVYVIQFAGYHLVRNAHRLRLKERQANDLLARARKQELASLKAQINPHFLFNKLNSISATLKTEPAQAREMIAMLAGMMRYALDSAEQDRVSLRREVTFVRQYLDLEHHRFSDRLEATIEVDVGEEELETLVPPMILQPLVENALQHGIAPAESGGTVHLSITKNSDDIDVKVTDTGVGPDAENPQSTESQGMGLANTSKRLEYAFGPDAALHTSPHEPTGFTVWFSIPRDATVAPA